MINKLHIFSLLILAVSLSGCAQPNLAPPSLTPGSATTEEPLLAEIISVETSYISANAQKCQNVLTANGAELRCFDGVQWQSIPSIYK